MKRFYFFSIDVCGACNLTCPTCPEGNNDVRLPKGILTVDLLHKVLTKATSECVMTGVNLYNWAEPMLHPQLPELIRIVHGYGLKCFLSSNLNRTQGIEKMMEAKPDSIRISCSGFTQESYGQTHRSGNIEIVKQNMRLVAKFRQPSTRVHMLWHRYKHNAQEEHLMRNFCDSLGFDFDAVDAYLMPIETVLERWSGKLPPLEIEKSLKNSVEAAEELCAPKKHYECLLQTQSLSLNHLGQVQLCCAVYDPVKFGVCDFMTTPIEEIRSLRLNHSFCGTCTAAGGHAYALNYASRDIGRLSFLFRSFYRNFGHRILPPKVAAGLQRAFTNRKVIWGEDY